MQKAPSLLGACPNLIGRRPTLPHTRACSTIGAEGLNYRVRDGNGWDPLATVTQSRGPAARGQGPVTHPFRLNRRLLNIDGFPQSSHGPYPSLHWPLVSGPWPVLCIY